MRHHQEAQMPNKLATSVDATALLYDVQYNNAH